jgi:hypothetical protein
MSPANSHFATHLYRLQKSPFSIIPYRLLFQIATFYPCPCFISHTAFTELRRLTQQ